MADCTMLTIPRPPSKIRTPFPAHQNSPGNGFAFTSALQNVRIDVIPQIQCIANTTGYGGNNSSTNPQMPVVTSDIIAVPRMRFHINTVTGLQLKHLPSISMVVPRLSLFRPLRTHVFHHSPLVSDIGGSSVTRKLACSIPKSIISMRMLCFIDRDITVFSGG